MKIIRPAIAIVAFISSMLSCKTGKQAIEGFGGDFTTQSNRNCTDTQSASTLNLFDGNSVISDIQSTVNTDKGVQNNENEKRLKHKSIVTMPIQAIQKIKNRISLKHKKRYNPSQTNGDSGGAVLVLLIIVALIIWALVKLAGISFGQVMLILGISTLAAILLVLVFAVVLNNN